jgi:epoxyqueuosine reductase
MELRAPMGMHVFGCDICQDVCPWNRRAPATLQSEFQPRLFPPALEGAATREESASAKGKQQTPAILEESLFLPRLEWLASMDETQFRRVFRGSAIKRTKWRGLVRNACIALGNADLRPGATAYERITALLQRLSASPDVVIAESALWALSRIQ